MRKEVHEPFIKSFEDVSQSYFNINVFEAEVSREKDLTMRDQEVVALGFRGDYKGVALFGAKPKEIDDLANRVLALQGRTRGNTGCTEEEWQEIKKSVFIEFGMQVVERTRENLYEQGLNTEVSVPSYINPQELENFRYSSISLKLDNELSNLNVKLHLEENVD